MSAEIRALAYQLWHKRGSHIGDPDIDWLEAERILKTELPKNARNPRAASLTLLQKWLKDKGINNT